MRCAWSRSRRGICRDEAVELADDLLMPAGGQIRLDRQLRRGQAQFLEPADLRRRERLVRHVGERIAAEQRERLTRRPVRDLAGARGPCRFGDEPVEPAHVDKLGVDPQLVGPSARDDVGAGVLAQQLAQPPDVVLQHLGGARRRLAFPQPFDQPVGRDRAVRLEAEHRQYRALLRSTERDRTVVDAGLDVAKDA
jgi:hypothetical protein